MGKISATICSKSKISVRSYHMSQLVFNFRELANTKLKFFKAILFKFKSCLKRRIPMKTIYFWPKMKELIDLRQKNKQNHVLCPIPQFQNLPENFNF